MNGRVLVIIALLCGGVWAADQAEQLYSRGLVEFHAGRYAEALALFDQATAASPDDVYARYYRGVTRGRLKDFEGAIADLRAVLARRPDFPEAALELGVALVETHRFAEAVPYLEQAQRVSSLDAQASLFLGLAQLRLGQDARARSSFQRAGAGDPALTVPARYYQGVAAYQAEQWHDAEEHFAAVVAANPDSAMGREAAQFVAALQARRPKAYQASAAVGFEYDTNITLAPSGDVLKDELRITDQDDGRVTVRAGGTYVPWQSERGLLSMGYEFFQSLHFDLTDFNLQDHRPSLQLAGRAGAARFGLLGRYDYYRLEDRNFLQEGTVSPWLTIMESGFGRTELFYRMRRRDFLDRDFRTRDSFNHAPGVRQVFEIRDPQRYVAFGYRFDREEAVRDDEVSQSFAYDGNEVSAGIAWVLPAAVAAEGTYAYREERYDAESGDRVDKEHRLIVVLQRAFAERFRLIGGYFGTLNNSNKDVFEYDRHIGSVALEVRF